MPRWLRYAGLLMVIALVMPLIVACGGSSEATATKGTTATEPAAASSPTESGTTGTATGAEPTKAAETPSTGSPVSSPPAGSAGRVEGGDLTFGQTLKPVDNKGGTLIEGAISDISTVLPIVTDDVPSSNFEALIFESMITVNPFTLEPVGLLAEAWESNETMDVWTIYLRDGVTWQDGKPFTAKDVKTTYDLHMNPDSGSSYTSDLTSKIKSVDVVDDHTVTFTLNHPLVDFLVDVAGYAIVADHIWGSTPAASVKTDGGATGQDPTRVVGTGPFKFKEWLSGDHATAVRYDDYWNGAAALDEYIMKVVPDRATGAQQLKTGEIDFFQGLLGSSVSEFKGSNVDVVAADALSFTFFGYNMDPARKGVFEDVNVRQALIYALDRDAMVEEIQFGFAQVAVGTMPPLSWAYNPDGIKLKYPYDVDKANQLLDEAGWVKGSDGVRAKDGKKLEFTMYTNAGNNVREQYLVAAQAYWNEIGVKMTPQLEPFPELVDRITETHDFDIFLIGFSWSATPDQSIMFGCNSYEGGFNFGKYCNEEVDKVLNEAMSEPDRAKRIELYTEFQNLMLADAPAAILDFPQSPTGVNQRLHNVFPSGINAYWNVNHWWVDKK
ncbi:MAG TPA: ABC transporter substrate-binding protein [Thermomicrobiales bacterium]|nr:ABC transporter substrate-binding protein [Thermomicrobiales bacterium]HRA33036.1 ABC transporter substrate-binding protein [Thermomicrobiales bacterium]